MKCKLKRTEAITTLQLLGWEPCTVYTSGVHMRNGHMYIWADRYMASRVSHPPSYDYPSISWEEISLAEMRRIIEVITE